MGQVGKCLPGCYVALKDKLTGKLWGSGLGVQWWEQQVQRQEGMALLMKLQDVYQDWVAGYGRL